MNNYWIRLKWRVAILWMHCELDGHFAMVSSCVLPVLFLCQAKLPSAVETWEDEKGTSSQSAKYGLSISCIQLFSSTRVWLGTWANAHVGGGQDIWGRQMAQLQSTCSQRLWRHPGQFPYFRVENTGRERSRDWTKGIRSLVEGWTSSKNHLLSHSLRWEVTYS